MNGLEIIFLAHLLSMMLGIENAQSKEFEYQIDHVDSYSSQHQLFKRDMCGQPSQKIRLELNQAEREELTALLEQSDFFKLKTDQRQYQNTEDGKVTVCSPCIEPELTIRHGHRRNRVVWNCDCDRGENVPQSIEPLVNRLKSYIESRADVQKLEPSDCVLH